MITSLANLSVCQRCPERALCRKMFEAASVCEHWPAPLPGMPTLAVRAAKEIGQWIASGAPKAGPDLIAHRRSVCAACPHWHAEAFAGAGRCMHPGCGCSGAKHHLPTSHCPMGQW